MASNSGTIVDGNGASSDWIEIYNPTGGAIDFTGWSLTDSASNPIKWVFPPTTVASHEYLLVFASNAAATGYIDPSGYRHTTFALSAGGEYLGLANPAGQIVSEFAPSFPSQSAAASYGLDGGGAAVYFATPTPGAANDLASAAPRSALISEIMYHPASELTSHEFIELYNSSAVTLQLGGWSLTGAVDFVFPAVSVAPGQYLAVAADIATFATLYPAVSNVIGGWEGKLSNRGETISLLNTAGQLVDGVTYTDQGDWADRELGPLDFNHRGWVWSDAHDGGAKSLELVSAGISNDSGQNWKASAAAGGTPGAANSVRDVDSNVAPLIFDVPQFPIIPSSSDPVTISARLVDELVAGVSATLFWRLDGAQSFQSIAMVDNGVGSDTVAGDRVFSAQLPPFGNGVVVEFYVQSADLAGNLRSYPPSTQPSGQQLTNLLFQVDDSFNPSALPAIGESPEYRLIMTAAERAELAQIGSSSSDRYSHARMNGTFIAVTSSGVEARYRVGIRNRGQGSSNQLPNSYHIDIPRDDLWQGLEAFNLNTQFTHAQLAGLTLFQATGVVAEDAQAVHVRVNGVDLSTSGEPAFGVYIQLEAADGVFVTNHYGDDDGGNLYRAVRDSSERARADFRDLGSDPLAYATYYEKQTNASEADYSDLMELVQVLNYEPDASFYARVSQIVDIDQWLNYFATIAILGSEETSIGTGVGDDYLLYRGVDDPRFQLIPHDFDTILGVGDTNGSATGSIYRAAALPTISRLLYHPQVLPAYHATLQRLLTTTFAQPDFNNLLDQTIGGFAPASELSLMKAFMDERRDYILDLINGPLTAVAPLSQQGGFARTEQSNVALYGLAPLVGTQSVSAGGLPAVYDPLSGQWSVGVATGVATNLLDTGDVWRYLNPGQQPTTTPGSDWRADAMAWAHSGPSRLGYGDTQATLVPSIDTNPGQSGTQRNITTYFQTTFNIVDAAEYSSLTMQLLRDDGAVVYLNGAEIARSNMPAGIITSTTLASTTVSGSDENAFFEFAIDPSLLVEGQNVIAVEIHQIGDSSSDIGFDLRLNGVLGEPSSSGGVTLAPGVNRIRVDAFDGLAGTGQLLDSTWVDVWYDAGTSQQVSGVISSPQHWTAAGGPYVVTGDLTIEAGGVLTIDPGVTVFFNSGTGVTVRNGGRLLAEGSASQRIRFAPNPSMGAAIWDGLSYINTMADNRLTFVDIQAAGASGQSVYVDHSRLAIDRSEWFDTNAQILDLVHPTLTVTNSQIPGISGDETVHLLGLNQGEQLVFENNIVGFNSSGGDVIDLGHDTLTPPQIIFRGNTFLGGMDDGVDTDGFPVLLENNVFHSFHLNTTRTTTSNAVSTGHMTVGGQTISSNLTLRGNVFYDNDHHLLIKDFSFATLENNTFVGATLSAIHMEEPGGSDVVGPGDGAAISGGLFWDNALVIEVADASTDLMVDFSLVPSDLIGLGAGNITGDPLFANAGVNDYSLLRQSPAIGAGSDGSEIGAVQIPDYLAADSTNLRITEFHYEPLPGDAVAGEISGTSKSFEFIELANISGSTIDLTDVAFDDGIEFVFPWRSSLEPGQVIVLVSNSDIYESRYGTLEPVFGEYSGSLSNDGEQIRLRDAFGGTIAEIIYEPVSQWIHPAAGHSLEIIDLQGAASAPANWRQSVALGGSPGIIVAPSLPGDFDVDGDVDDQDYQVWHGQYGAIVAQGSGADGNHDGRVDAADYTVWRDNYAAAQSHVGTIVAEARAKAIQLAPSGSNEDAAAVSGVLPSATPALEKLPGWMALMWNDISGATTSMSAVGQALIHKTNHAVLDAAFASFNWRSYEHDITNDEAVRRQTDTEVQTCRTTTASDLDGSTALHRRKAEGKNVGWAARSVRSKLR